MADSQFLGEKGDFIYVDDTGQEIKIKRDLDLAVLNTGLTAFDPAVNTTAIGKPLGFKPRGVWWESTEPGFEGRRKFLICGAPNAALYASSVPVAQTIAGVAGVTTGRRGESLRYI